MTESQKFLVSVIITVPVAFAIALILVNLIVYNKLPFCR